MREKEVQKFANLIKSKYFCNTFSKERDVVQ